jgi:hypothetical protein
MNKPDDLDSLWKAQPLDTGMRGEEMRGIVLKKIACFDRAIRRRNRAEIVAAVVVSASFAYFAWLQRNGIERLGSIIIAASALWIIYYIWRFGSEPGDPDPDQSAASYRRALALKYQHQIRLLRNVKFWYLLPMYVGLLISSAGLLTEHAKNGVLSWTDAIGPLVYTVFFAAVWWLNEVYTIRKLRRWQLEVTSGAEGETQC